MQNLKDRCDSWIICDSSVLLLHPHVLNLLNIACDFRETSLPSEALSIRCGVVIVETCCEYTCGADARKAVMGPIDGSTISVMLC